MTDDELRTLVREAIARHLGEGPERSTAEERLLSQRPRGGHIPALASSWCREETMRVGRASSSPLFTAIIVGFASRTGIEGPVRGTYPPKALLGNTQKPVLDGSARPIASPEQATRLRLPLRGVENDLFASVLSMPGGGFSDPHAVPNRLGVPVYRPSVANHGRRRRERSEAVYLLVSRRSEVSPSRARLLRRRARPRESGNSGNKTRGVLMVILECGTT